MVSGYCIAMPFAIGFDWLAGLLFLISGSLGVSGVFSVRVLEAARSRSPRCCKCVALPGRDVASPGIFDGDLSGEFSEPLRSYTHNIRMIIIIIAWHDCNCGCASDECQPQDKRRGAPRLCARPNG